jgi:triosephosphate isomerase
VAAARPPPLIVGNWKNHGVTCDLAEAGDLARALADHPAAAEVVICPPATLLATMSRLLDGSGVATGAQDCDAHGRAAHTGAATAAMLRDAGARLVLAGHSERRRFDGETDRDVAAKAAAAVAAGLEPILCIGETAAQRASGEALQVLGRQVERCCPRRLQGRAFAIAYEPVWAVGTGLTPEPAEIEAAVAAIRRALALRLGEGFAAARILYGGSVDGANAAALSSLAGVDGLLVGRASQRASDFLPVIRAVAAARPEAIAVAR